ncbi:MAG TPA: SLATT domain-containing protein [Actinomycetota bacterium]|nr:SLATT domain-containing protein [Actinomycetota bacterium]
MATTPTKPSRLAWDDALENLYESWHRRVAAAEHGHRLMADRLRRRYLMLGIPVVVLTTVVGTSAFASVQNASETGDGAANSQTWLIVVGVISVLAAVLSSLQTFLRYATRAEGHRIAALRYETLRRDMAETLALPRDARGQPEGSLNSARQRMDRYAKESPTIGERMWVHLANVFHLSTVPPDPVWRGEPITVAGEDGDGR